MSKILAAPLLAAAFCAAPAMAAPVPTGDISDADLAAWVAEGLVAANPVPLSRDSLLASKGHRNDLAIAREASAVLARVGVIGMVVGCTDGTLELRGSVADEAAREKATRLTSAIDGVTQVRNALRLPGEDVAAAEAPAVPINEAAVAERDAPARTEPFDFLVSGDRAGRNIVVHVRDGVVDLAGEVNSREAARYAVAAAQRIPGVRAVRTDGLAIRRNGREDDRRLALVVQRLLEWDVDVQTVSGAILVTVQDGVAHLSGKVRDATQAEQARAIAAGTTDVFAVSDDLVVDADLTVPASKRISGFKLFRAW